VKSRVLAWSVLLTAALTTGCAADGTSGEPPVEGASTSSSGSSGSSGADPTDPESATPSEPEVVPASGERLTIATVERDVFGFRLPEGDWSIGASGRTALRDSPEGATSIGAAAATGADGVSLDFLARADKRDFAAITGTKVVRQDNRSVDGIDGYVLEASTSDGLSYKYGSVLGDTSLTVTFEFPEDTPEARAEIESVLASAAWQ
jgi:hypothetical protein